MVVLTKKSIIIALALFLAVLACITIFPNLKNTTTPMGVYTIVLDAGHGGQDGGCIGKTTKVTESFLNLKYSKDLETRLSNLGFKVVMTRSDMNGLYSPLASNKKRSEMEKRKEIIEKSNADLIVSIHMNSFPTKSARGAQVLYQKGNEAGKQFAMAVQVVLAEVLPNAKKTPGAGDFFVLNCTEKPGVLVECGFLSNAEEEALLVSDSYMQRFNTALVAGILAFVGR